MKGSVSVRRSIKILVWVWVLAVAGSPCAAQPQQDTPSTTEDPCAAQPQQDTPLTIEDPRCGPAATRHAVDH